MNQIITNLYNTFGGWLMLGGGSVLILSGLFFLITALVPKQKKVLQAVISGVTVVVGLILLGGSIAGFMGFFGGVKNDIPIKVIINTHKYWSVVQNCLPFK